MPVWLWVGSALLVFCGGCFALVWAAILGGARHDQRIDELVEQFDWDAAEDDLERRRP